MWTILFGSIVNKTSHLAGSKELLIANSFGMLLFVFVSFRYLRIFSLKMDCIAQAKRIEGDDKHETLVVVFNAFIVVMATYLMLFDLYHQNILSAAKGGGLVQPAEAVRVSFFNNRFGFDVTTPSTELYVKLANFARRFFNPLVYFDKKPLLSWNVIDLAGKYITVVKNWFQGTSLMQSAV